MVYTIKEIAEMYAEEFETSTLDEEWAATAYTEAFAHTDQIDYAEFAEQLRQALKIIA
jgi:hypothetical protein